MNRRHISILLILVLLAGCLDGFPGLRESGDYDLSITNVTTQTQDNGVLFRGTVSLSGSLGSGAIVSDVSVRFIDQSGSTMSTINVGTLSIGTVAGSEPRPSENFTVQLSEHPASIIIETGFVESDSNINIYGLNRTSEGGFDYHVIETKN